MIKPHDGTMLLIVHFQNILLHFIDKEGWRLTIIFVWLHHIVLSSSCLPQHFFNFCYEWLKMLANISRACLHFSGTAGTIQCGCEESDFRFSGKDLWFFLPLFVYLLKAAGCTRSLEHMFSTIIFAIWSLVHPRLWPSILCDDW